MSLRIFLFAAIVLQLSQIIFFKQTVFFDKYDANYWKDRYEHSQYRMPLSKRTIGDDGLYAYAGYRSVKGDNPFSINIDKPPLGNYLVGASILIFKNPAWYALIFGVGCLIVFYRIAAEIFDKKIFVYFAFSLLLLDPLFANQLWGSWLDISQLFFLLLHILLLMSASKNNRLILFFVSGISLGLFAEIKPPLFLPLVIALDWFFLSSENRIKKAGVVLSGLAVGIFTPYFINLRPTEIMQILKIHKYIYSISFSSGVKLNPIAVWQVIGWGEFPNIITKIPAKVLEWWIIWPATVAVGIFFGIKFFNKFSKIMKYTFLFFALGLLLLMCSPFYTRYLLLLLPFIYLLFAKVLSLLLKPSHTKVVFTLIIIFGLLNSFYLFYPRSDSVLKDFYYNMSHFYFQDIYQQDIRGSDLGSRESFFSTSRNLFEDATIKSLNVKELKRNVPFYADKGYVDAEFTYYTSDLGIFQQAKRILLTKKNQQWRVNWDWSILLDNYKPEDVVEAHSVPGKRGSILAKSGKKLAYDDVGYVITINPQNIDLKREEEMLKFLGSFSTRQPIQLQNAYLENPTRGKDIELTTFFITPSESELQKLFSFKGLALKQHAVRLYNGMDPKLIKNTLYEECCTSVYSSYSYHGVSGDERKFDDILSAQNGGMLILKNKDNVLKNIIIQKDVINGEDVQIEL